MKELFSIEPDDCLFPLEDTDSHEIPDTEHNSSGCNFDYCRYCCMEVDD